MIDPETIQPLGDRLVVKKLPVDEVTASGLIVIRENPHLQDMIGDGANGEHNDNRRVFIRSIVVSCGSKVRGIKPGDVVMHTDWSDADLPGYALIRQGDIGLVCNA